MCLVDLYVFPWTYEAPGMSGVDHRFPTFFPHRFLDGFLMDFGSMFDHFFDDFPMIFASLFRDLLLIDFQVFRIDF